MKNKEKMIWSAEREREGCKRARKPLSRTSRTFHHTSSLEFCWLLISVSASKAKILQQRCTRLQVVFEVLSRICWLCPYFICTNGMFVLFVVHHSRHEARSDWQWPGELFRGRFLPSNSLQLCLFCNHGRKHKEFTESMCLYWMDPRLESQPRGYFE